MAEEMELRWIVLYCLYSWALVHLCFLYAVHGDVLRHTRISGILMESRHSVADGDDATNRRRHPGNPVAGVTGLVLIHSSQVRQIGTTDQDPIASPGDSFQPAHRMDRVAFLTEFFPEIRSGKAAGFPEIDRDSAPRRAWRWSVQCDVGELSRKVT